MPRRLFLPGADLTVPSIQIAGPDFHHLVNVLRMQPGEDVVILDNHGNGCRAEITRIGKREIEAAIVGPETVPPEPATHVTIAQALGKGDRFEQVIQHCTELGASAFIPLVTERTVVRLTARATEIKLTRWRAIAKGAAEQAGRARIPTIQPVSSLHETLRRSDDYAVRWMLDQGGERLQNSQVQKNCVVLVGPEGGFAADEIKAGNLAGVQIVSLSPHTLRTETAALAALSRILS